MNKRIKKADLLCFLDFYEKNYLFFSEVKEYDEKKKRLLQSKNVNCNQFTKWLKENYSEDVYSKCYMIKKRNTMSCRCRTMYGGIEYIHILSFCEEIIPFIERAVSVDADYLVIDLRDNCGGSVGVLTKCLPYFLAGNGTIELQSRNGFQTINVVGAGRPFRKIFLLVNENTMSCAEMLMMVLYENMENVYVVGGLSFMKDKGQATIKKGKLVASVTNFYWYVSGKKINDFWMLPEKRKIGVGQHLSEDEMMNIIYSHLE